MKRASALSLLLVLSCGEPTSTPLPNPALPATTDSLVVSDLSQRSLGLAMINATQIVTNGVAFVGAPAGTYPSGSRGWVRSVARGYTFSVALPDGGFSPVAVPAGTGDDISVEVGSATATVSAKARVPASRRPRVIRTSPTRRKADVPLNARLTIVFSEPVDGTTLTPQNVQLLRGNTPVGGTIRFVDSSLDATGLSVEFVPSAVLLPNTAYRLVLGAAIKDLDGESIGEFDAIDFVTGQGNTGPPDRIQLSPDSTASIPIDATVQLSAVVLDAAGNRLNDNVVSWSSTNPSVVSITASGRLTALTEGAATIMAQVSGAQRALIVTVLPNPVATLTLTPPTEALEVGAIASLVLQARDAEGRVIRTFPTSWQSSDPTGVWIDSVDPQDDGSIIALIHTLKMGTFTVTARSGIAEARATITVVEPRPTAIRVVASTTGSDPDPDGYAVCINPTIDPEVNDGTYGYECEASGIVASNGDVTLSVSGGGTYAVWLPELAANCGVANARRSIVVPGRDTVETTFNVTCEHFDTVVPYGTEYRYKIVGSGSELPAGFALPAFDDQAAASGFATGSAPFGNVGGCDLNDEQGIRTPWVEYSELLLRKTFTLPAGVTRVRIGVAIDNDVQVFLNGVDITSSAGPDLMRGGFQIHGGCAEKDSFVFRVPDDLLVAGPNVLALRARDRGGLTYADLRIIARLP